MADTAILISSDSEDEIQVVQKSVQNQKKSSELAASREKSENIEISKNLKLIYSASPQTDTSNLELHQRQIKNDSTQLFASNNVHLELQLTGQPGRAFSQKVQTASQPSLPRKLNDINLDTSKITHKWLYCSAGNGVYLICKFCSQKVVEKDGFSYLDHLRTKHDNMEKHGWETFSCSHCTEKMHSSNVLAHLKLSHGLCYPLVDSFCILYYTFVDCGFCGSKVNYNKYAKHLWKLHHKFPNWKIIGCNRCKCGPIQFKDLCLHNICSTDVVENNCLTPSYLHNFVVQQIVKWFTNYKCPFCKSLRLHSSNYFLDHIEEVHQGRVINWTGNFTLHLVRLCFLYDITLVVQPPTTPLENSNLPLSTGLNDSETPREILKTKNMKRKRKKVEKPNAKRPRHDMPKVIRPSNSTVTTIFKTKNGKRENEINLMKLYAKRARYSATVSSSQSDYTDTQVKGKMIKPSDSDDITATTTTNNIATTSSVNTISTKKFKEVVLSKHNINFSHPTTRFSSWNPGPHRFPGPRELSAPLGFTGPREFLFSREFPGSHRYTGPCEFPTPLGFPGPREFSAPLGFPGFHGFNGPPGFY